jgi:arginyl-tRNA--protein-N-Asp/Glu arginylyltransferase
MDANRTSVEFLTSPSAERDQLSLLTPEHACPYLPDRVARHEAYQVRRLDGTVYERLLSRGFRRSGRVVYRPRCQGCCACRQIRVVVDGFEPTRSMRRVQRLNADVEVQVDHPILTEEKYDVFQRYLSRQHDDSMDGSRESLREFLYSSPTSTFEFTYRIDGRLMAASIVDRVPMGLSSVYVYFEPDFRERSPGVFSALYEIEYCRGHGLPFYYLGYHVADSPKMSYKARYRPNEVLAGDGRWVSLAR